MSDSTALATRSQNGAAAEHDLTHDQVELIRRTIAKDATADELSLFLYQARRTGLDPLARQIHFVKRQGKGTIQTAIDGYRLIADRTRAYAGNDDAVFSGVEEVGQHAFPAQATVTVWKIVQGVRCPFTSTARWSEYCPTAPNDFMWRKMPHTMLAKCAEAQALRKAFPAELSGVYVDQEMHQAGPSNAADLGLEGEVLGVQPVPDAPVKESMGPIYRCEDCTLEITDAPDHTGELIPAIRIASRTCAKYKRQLCATCAKKAAGATR